MNAETQQQQAAHDAPKSAAKAAAAEKSANAEANALRQKSAEELRGEHLALRREGFNLRMQLAVQQTGKTSELKRVRRQTARVLTILAEKGRAAGGGGGASSSADADKKSGGEK